MKCIICEIGELKPGKTTFTMKRDQSVIVFEDVPALICENCGEEFFEEEVNGNLLKQAENILKSQPKLGIYPFMTPNRNGSVEHAVA